jgi:conjugal transfer/entry exclusion protein
MSKKYMKRAVLGSALAMATMGSGSVFALGVPVFDAANFVSNTVTAVKTTLIWKEMLKANSRLTSIDNSLTGDGKNTMLSHTTNIDESTTNIDNTTTHIDNTTTNIDKTTTQIYDITQSNYEINKEFNTTNNYYGVDDGGIIPTDGLDTEVAAMLAGANVDAYVGNYKDAQSYEDNVATKESLADVGVTASQNEKKANDALVKTLSSHSESIKQQEDGLNSLVQGATEAQGHGRQLQYANALAGAQAAQLMQIREMMLASENARAATAQADADRTARHTAASLSLRQNLTGGNGGIEIK